MYLEQYYMQGFPYTLVEYRALCGRWDGRLTQWGELHNYICITVFKTNETSGYVCVSALHHHDYYQLLEDREISDPIDICDGFNYVFTDIGKNLRTISKVLVVLEDIFRPIALRQILISMILTPPKFLPS